MRNDRTEVTCTKCGATASRRFYSICPQCGTKLLDVATEKPQQSKRRLWKDLALVVGATAIGGVFYLARSVPDVTAVPRSHILTLQGSHSEVLLKKFGRPYRTSLHGDTELWYYDGISQDPISGKVDRSTQFVIKERWIESVNF